MVIHKTQKIEEIKNLLDEKAVGIAFSNEVADAYMKKGYATILVSENDDALFGADSLVYDEEDLDDEYIEHVYRRHYKMLCDVLETKRTKVREIGADDYDELKELYSYPEILEFIEPLYEKEKELKYQKDYYDNIYSFYDIGMWGVFDKESGKLIGRCGIDPHEYGIELGYIISPKYQRQGIAYEVCTAIIEYAKSLEITELLAKIDKDNEASLALAKKLGFEFLKEDYYILVL